MKRFLITFSYDGTNFSGYQKQPNERTIQEELEKSLTRSYCSFIWKNRC